MRFIRPAVRFLLLATAALILGCSQKSEDVAESSSIIEDQASATLADQLAAHPADPSKPKNITGVTDEELQTDDRMEKAADACMNAVEKNPQSARCHFELGRVLVLGGLAKEGTEELEAAASRGHGGAYFYLAQLKDDLGEVGEFLQKASDAGFKPADEMLAQLSPADEAPEVVANSSIHSAEENVGSLREQQVTVLQWSMLGPIADVPIDARDSVTAQVQQVMQSGQKILVCSYGTSETDNRILYFWYQSAPANLAALINGVEKHPLRRLGTKAVSTPPPNLEAALQSHE
jgi:hypothetical protein